MLTVSLRRCRRGVFADDVRMNRGQSLDPALEGNLEDVEEASPSHLDDEPIPKPAVNQAIPDLVTSPRAHDRPPRSYLIR